MMVELNGYERACYLLTEMMSYEKKDWQPDKTKSNIKRVQLKPRSEDASKSKFIDFILCLLFSL